MPRDRSIAQWLGAALLGVVALALAAATLTSTVSDPRGGAPGGPEGDGPGFFPTPEPPEPPAEFIDLPLLGDLLTVLLVVGVLLAVAYALVHRREALRTLVLVVVLAALAYLLFEALAGLSGGGGTGGLPLGGSDGVLGSGGEERSSATELPAPPVLLLAIFAFAFLVAVAAVLRSTGGDAASDAPPDQPGDVAAVGRAAGRAADRIREGTHADNEVYRAWREMTGLLDVPNPESSTPGEFADAAVAAGMTAGDVDELTRLFESVRYGGVDPDRSLERRALSAFDRIEASYAEDG